MESRGIRWIIRKGLQRFGYDIVKTKPVFRPGQLSEEAVLQELGWLRKFGFRSILDIGANEGQFSAKMRIIFPDATIVAFEPLPEVFATLENNFTGDDKFHAVNCGLGSSSGKLQFHLNESSASSSFLEMSDVHLQHFEKAAPQKTVEVKVEKLDDIIRQYQLELPMLIKFDVQGYEAEVIAGGKETISGADAIISELSFHQLYKGQPLFDDIYQLLKSAGFVYAGSIEQLHAPGDNSILQADGFFVKP